MVSETSMPALLGHVTALLHNPNNTSREASKVGTEIEREAIGDLLKMVGFRKPNALGHFTSGGTVANLEGAWRAMYRLDRTMALELFARDRNLFSARLLDELRGMGWERFDKICKAKQIKASDLTRFSLLETGPWDFQAEFRRITGRDFAAPLLFVPASRHFSWAKIITLLGLGASSLREVPLDSGGRMSVTALSQMLNSDLDQGRSLLGVVSVLGSTELGAVDPIDKIQRTLDAIAKKRGVDIWHHIDAAYGGYFASMVNSGVGSGLSARKINSLSSRVMSALKALGRANSITLDPHKLGYVPYTCGAILCRDELHYRVRNVSAPYLLKNNNSQWINTIEGSRSATGAAGTWMANRALGLGSLGYGRVLEKGLQARLRLVELLRPLSNRIHIVPSLDLNVICLVLAYRGESVRRANERTLAIFEDFMQSPEFSISKTTLAKSSYGALIADVVKEKKLNLDDDQLVCLRLVLMNPFTNSKEVRFDYLAEFTKELRHYVDRFQSRSSKISKNRASRNTELRIS
jgi:glutamate/tyrosine decarboxylase-like PLP-dependent enzyme